MLLSCKRDFDPINRILRSTFQGRVTDKDVLNDQRMMLLLTGFLDPLGAIVDLSDADPFEATPDGLRHLAKLPPAMPKADRSCVVVAPSDYIFGLVRIFEIEGGATRPNLHVVRSTDEAYGILALWEPRFEEISKFF